MAKGTEMTRSKKMADVDKSEKITINVGLVDLGQIDLLVSEGFFANRTDFIRTAIRRQLETRSSAVDRTVVRRELTLGTEHYAAATWRSSATPVAWWSCACSGWRA
jgi:Arc/MetJ-type ribon-helix-helix transcriptional regulator